MEAAITPMVMLKGWTNQTFSINANINTANSTLVIKNLSKMLEILEHTKEGLYIAGIKNLRRKVNFLQLNYEFQTGEITDEEFEKELDANPTKYVVDVRGVNNAIEFKVINEIVNKLGEDLNIDEIGEIFSIDLSSENNTISKIQ